MENICLLGDHHIEQSILGLHGNPMKESGLDSVLAHICVIYKLLKEAHADNQSNLSLFDWLEERSKISQMAYYWRLILNFQIQVLIFVRSVRTGKLSIVPRNFVLLSEMVFYPR